MPIMLLILLLAIAAYAQTPLPDEPKDGFAVLGYTYLCSFASHAILAIMFILSIFWECDDKKLLRGLTLVFIIFYILMALAYEFSGFFIDFWIFPDFLSLLNLVYEFNSGFLPDSWIFPGFFVVVFQILSLFFPIFWVFAGFQLLFFQILSFTIVGITKIILIYIIKPIKKARSIKDK